VNQAADTVDVFRDVLSGMLDAYLSTLGMRMNEVMKVLTMFSTIFIPTTFIASFFGMNFTNMPFAWPWGFGITIVVMILVVVGMIIFFKKKKWI
jgi:magnesium transporter